MKIYNNDKSKILENVDLSIGYLKRDRLLVSEEQQEESHYEEKHYDNGGIARYKKIDKPYKPAEYEEIQVYILYTEKELNQNKIDQLDNWFKNDYRMYAEMLTRREKLGIEDTIVDEFRNKTYRNIMELYTEAEVVAKEIRELKAKETP